MNSILSFNRKILTSLTCKNMHLLGNSTSEFFRTLPRFVSIALLALLAYGCGTSSTDPVKRSFDPTTTTTEISYDSTLTNGSPGYVRVKGMGKEKVEINGHSYHTYQVDYGNSAAPKRLHVWGEQDGDTYKIAGFEKVGRVNVKADSPVVISANIPKGKPKTIKATGTFTTPTDPTPQNASVSGTYTLEDTDATIVTKAGTLSGVSVYSANLVLTGLFNNLLSNNPIKVKVWYRSDLGVVKASLPDFGAGMNIEGEGDCGSTTAGYTVISKMGTVAPGQADFELNTYDCLGGQYRADKNSHAQMLLELRWANEEMAKTDTPPAVREEFGTLLGYFPEFLAPSNTSIFHPDENGKGYVFWYAFVNQAAKNTAGDAGIAYHIKVSPTQKLNQAVRATARIRYKVLP